MDSNYSQRTAAKSSGNLLIFLIRCKYIKLYLTIEYKRIFFRSYCDIYILMYYLENEKKNSEEGNGLL